MSDLNIRSNNRLVDRLRAGLLMPRYTTVREVARSWGFVEGGRKQPGLVPFDSMDQVRLMSFLGDVEAREIVPICETDCDKQCYDSAGEKCRSGALIVSPVLSSWVAQLQDLTTKLPPHQMSMPTWNCSGEKRTARIHTQAKRYLLVIAALAVGRACRPLLAESCFECDLSDGCTCYDWWAIDRALDAGDAWVKEPTLERGQIQADEYRSCGRHPLWLWAYQASEGEEARVIQAAAEIIGKARVREITAAAVLSVV